ncbi:MAG: TIM barrel protein [Chloroflexi bacterium]|nr:TIM barrel protein [Chloroflexota bacterium]
MTDAPGYPMATIPGYRSSQPGLQIGTTLPPTASEEDMRFARQLGVEWVATRLDDPASPTAEDYVALRRRFEAHGLKIYRVANARCQNMPEVTLGLPERDERIAEFIRYVRALGEAGIYHATYAHMANGIWRTGREAVRGGARHSAFRLQEATAGHWGGQSWQGQYTHGRAYREEELWDAYAYFIRRVVPVAEEAGVFIGVHPDDPPVYPLGGIPRCIFGTFGGFVRALDMADSPNWGMSLCVGTWLEGGAAMGKDAVETIRHFGQRKLFHIHFRNITAPLPEGFAETYLDDGFMDMHQVMRALREVSFDGLVVSDHLPEMVGGQRAAEALAVGYMRALAQAVNNAFGGPTGG